MPFTEEQEARMRAIFAQEVKRLFGDFVTPAAYVSSKDFILLNGRNIQLGTSVGTKIGTGVNQKLGFFDTTPVVQQNAINSPSGGATVDGAARAAVDDVITALGNLGLIAV